MNLIMRKYSFPFMNHPINHQFNITTSNLTLPASTLLPGHHVTNWFAQG